MDTDSDLVAYAENERLRSEHVPRGCMGHWGLMHVTSSRRVNINQPRMDSDFYIFCFLYSYIIESHLNLEQETAEKLHADDYSLLSNYYNCFYMPYSLAT